jgi:SulP family sulfate permease
VHINLKDYAPFLYWIRRYRNHHFKADLLAGLTVAVIAVPQSMAYALIAGLPIQYGLYASIFPTMVGCLWGSSAHLITGPTTAISLVVFSALSTLAPTGTLQYLELAFFLALMVGLLQIVMGIARFGALLNYVSHSVILGFTAGAAVLIAFKQLPALLNLEIERGGIFFESLFNILANLHHVHPLTLLLGGMTIGIILVVKRLRPTWPGTLIAMIIVGLVVTVFHLDARGVIVVGSIPRNLPPFHFPSLSLGIKVSELAPGALAIAILGLVEAVSIAKSISAQTRQQLNINREIIGQGLANITASLFSGYAVSGSFTRSAVNFRSGAKTPISGVISGVAVAITLLLIAPLASKLPLSALSGVLIIVAYEMVRKEDIKRAMRATRSDAAVLITTFLSTLLLNIEFAIYVGVLLAIGLHLAKTSHPRIYSMVPDLKTGKMIGSVYGQKCPQMDIVRIEGSIFFGSSTYIHQDLQTRLSHHPNTANLLLRMHLVNVLDASGVHVLEMLYAEVRRRGGSIYFAGINNRVFEVIKNSGFIKVLGETHLRVNTGSAIRQAMRETYCPAVCKACDMIVFKECPELTKGNWTRLGPDVHPKLCTLTPEDKKAWSASRR